MLHPVIAGYHCSTSSRNALAYAAGMARGLGRPLLIVYITPLRVYWEPFSGQVITQPRDPEALERWLLGELDQVADPTGLEVHVRARQGNPARELSAMASRFRADALVIGAPRPFFLRLSCAVPGNLARHASCPLVVVP
jgi:nucleotide-binding universal stress UspA family protein